MNYENVLPYLSRGDFGKYQKKIYFLLCLPSIVCAFHKLAGVFLLAVPDHRCRLEHEYTNASFDLSEEIRNRSIPFDSDKNEFSKCEYINQATGLSSHCTEYIWNTTLISNSATKSFELVCDRSSSRASADSFMMLGVLVGSYVFGDLSDKFGRKPTFVLALMIQVVFGLLAAITTNFISFTICRMIVGATTSGVVLVSYCLSLELVNKQSRLYAGTIVMLFFSAGYILVGGISYFIHDWRYLQTALSLSGIFFLVYFWVIPESVPWLLANNKKDEAIVVIRKVAKANKLTVPDEILENLESNKKNEDSNIKKPSLLDLFKTPYMRMKTLVIFFDWFVLSGTYYGLSWSTNNLGGNQLLNFVISGLVEIPACIILIVTLNRYGRKKILCGSMVLGGIVLILSVMVPTNFNSIIILLTMIGKMSITLSYGAIYIFSAEQYPTVIRNVALGASSMSARIGGISAPYLNYLSVYWKPAPFFVFGLVSFIGGGLSLFLPETQNKELPETLEDGENLGKDLEKFDKEVELSMLNRKERDN